jgi:hypothetical protein
MLPDLSRLKIGPEGVEVEKDPDRISANEDLQPRNEQLTVKELEYLNLIRQTREKP